ncbi:MAG: hypothetical protein F6J90_16925 [Moorea sp. SIOASIH]|nr:hypothetical protein [Moorena sp. SIOASIH]
MAERVECICSKLFDPVGGMGILVERASWWNGHLGGTGILVERASWWNGHLGGTGILVERASCPLSIFSGRAVPTLAVRYGQQPNTEKEAENQGEPVP